MKCVLAIDPGTTHSGVVFYDPESGNVIYANKAVENVHVVALMVTSHGADVVCETISNMGQVVGKSTFTTVRWVGRFEQARRSTELPFHTIDRVAVKKALCPKMRAVKDSHIRAALIARYGGDDAIGNISNKGPLYGVASHAWQALAVAIVWADLNGTTQQRAS